MPNTKKMSAAMREETAVAMAAATAMVAAAMALHALEWQRPSDSSAASHWLQLVISSPEGPGDAPFGCQNQEIAHFLAPHNRNTHTTDR
jgi:hypothetical protein